MLELYILLAFMILGAIIAVEVRDLLSSVVAVGAVGLGLSIAFLILKAPDLAIVQLVVEILALIFLIRATIGTDVIPVEKGEKIITILVGIAFTAVFLMFAGFCLAHLPIFGYPEMRVAQTYIEHSLNKTGAANIVSAIILDFRGYDTLGEATVLFTAVIGSLAILRKTGRKK
jgi:multisubunit Na+/H+ antiporter MnhB subunit